MASHILACILPLSHILGLVFFLGSRGVSIALKWALFIYSSINPLTCTKCHTMATADHAQPLLVKYCPFFPPAIPPLLLHHQLTLPSLSHEWNQMEQVSSWDWFLFLFLFILPQGHWDTCWEWGSFLWVLKWMHYRNKSNPYTNLTAIRLFWSWGDYE